MNVKQAIEQLQKLPGNAHLMVASQEHGGSVPLQGFIEVEQIVANLPVWVDVVYCDNEERARYGLNAEVPQ